MLKQLFKKISSAFSLLQQTVSRVKDSTISMNLARIMIDNETYLQVLVSCILDEPIAISDLAHKVETFDTSISAYQSFIVVFCNDQTIFDSAEKLRQLVLQVRTSSSKKMNISS